MLDFSYLRIFRRTAWRKDVVSLAVALSLSVKRNLLYNHTIFIILCDLKKIGQNTWHLERLINKFVTNVFDENVLAIYESLLLIVVFT